MGNVAEPVKAVLEIGSSVLLALGGGGAIFIGICGFFSQFMANRAIESHKGELASELERLKGDLSKDVETHKLALRKAELLFDREVLAASEFLALNRKVRPEYAFPDMDWHDACANTASRFGTIERDLIAYQIKHGAVLPAKVRDLLSEAETVAAHNKFDIAGSEHTPSTDAIDAAGELLDKLKEIENQLLADLKG